MQVGILGGTGPEGRGLALRLGKAGFTVTIGSRSLEQAKRTAEELQPELDRRGLEGRILGQENRRVAGSADLIFLAAPFEHVAGLLRTCLGCFREGQILVDVTVPLHFRDKRLELRQLSEPSGSQVIAKALPESIPLVAAFKTIPARLLSDLEAPLDCHVFVCSDFKQARDTVIEVASKISGLSPLDVGPLREAATLERMAVLAIQVNKRHRVKFSRFRLVGL